MESQGADSRVVDGRFELLGRLGSGGMGTVWRARDVALHREVALKEVRPADPAMLDGDPGAARMLRERVLREARALARLAHPHVVAIHHIVDSPDHPFPWIVMELVQGDSLQARLARGPLPVPEAVRIGRGVLSALRAAHAVGIHHRDIKPANVLLRPDGSPVLTDFGIAALRESTSLTATGDLIGSPEYIAPERIRGQEGNPASDLWSLGMLLYVCVEGSHPLRRETSLATLVAVMDEPVPPPVRAGSLAPVLNALLVRDPSARPDAPHLDRLLADAEREPEDARPSFAPPPSYGPPSHGAPNPGLSTPFPATPYPPTPQPGYPGPGSAGWSPSPGSGFGPVPSTPPAPRPGRAGRRVGTAVVAGLAVAALSLIAYVLPKLGADAPPKGKTPAARQDRSGGNAPASDAPASDKPADKAADEPADSAPKALLTPSGVRKAVSAFRDKTGTSTSLDFTVYEDYAISRVPTRNDAKLYDQFQYRNGYVEKFGSGGTRLGAQKPVDLKGVNWDALPGLMKKADKELGIDKPTSRYVIVDTDIISAVPSLKVYLADEYGGAYLKADLQGTVQQVYPRE